MSGAQRAFWVDLMAMAARSRFPGVVVAGKDGDTFVGYPLKIYEAYDAKGEIDVLETFELFRKADKILVEITHKAPIPLYKITILNWDKYQSEYQRTKKYRQQELLPQPIYFKGQRLEITASVHESLKQAYQGLDLDAEYKKMDAWLVSNQRTYRNYGRFANSWLSRYKVNLNGNRNGGRNGFSQEEYDDITDANLTAAGLKNKRKPGNTG